MAYTDETLARGIAKRVIREVRKQVVWENDAGRLGDRLCVGPKKNKREIHKLCSTNSRFVFLDERHKEKTRWEVVWGSWGLSYTGVEPPESFDEFNRLAFYIRYSGKSVMLSNHMNFILSHHALIRLIMRSGKKFDSLDQVLKFLKPVARDAVLAGLSSLEGNSGSILHSNGYYLPFELQTSNDSRKQASTYVIKTLLREDFDMKYDEIVKESRYKDSFFDYLHLFSSDHRDVTCHIR